MKSAKSLLFVLILSSMQINCTDQQAAAQAPNVPLQTEIEKLRNELEEEKCEKKIGCICMLFCCLATVLDGCQHHIITSNLRNEISRLKLRETFDVENAQKWYKLYQELNVYYNQCQESITRLEQENDLFKFQSDALRIRQNCERDLQKCEKTNRRSESLLNACKKQKTKAD
jgi:hypothetical protein